MPQSTPKLPPISVTVTKDQRQRDRARRWQIERLRSLADRIEAGEFIEASKADIDAAFRV